jgi:hypothetical protein
MVHCAEMEEMTPSPRGVEDTTNVAVFMLRFHDSLGYHNTYNILKFRTKRSFIPLGNTPEGFKYLF